MKSFLDQTVDTYRTHFDAYLDQTVVTFDAVSKRWLDSFLSYLPRHGSIFEIGSASGRDARYFSDRGYKVFCTDVVPQVLDRLSLSGFSVSSFDFRDTPDPAWVGQFDGLFANAVFLHVPCDDFERVLSNVSSVLKDGGVMAFSLKIGEGEEVSYEKLHAPRYYCYYSEERLREVLKACSLRIIDSFPDDQNAWLRVVVARV